MEEAGEKGWLSGLYRAPYMDRLLGTSEWVMLRRFDVVQGEKVRPIDDGSGFLQHATVTPNNKADRGGIDEYVSLRSCGCELSVIIV